MFCCKMRVQSRPSPEEGVTKAQRTDLESAVLFELQVCHPRRRCPPKRHPRFLNQHQRRAKSKSRVNSSYPADQYSTTLGYREEKVEVFCYCSFYSKLTTH